MKLAIVTLLAGTCAATIARPVNGDATGAVKAVKVSAYCTGLDSHSLSAKAIAYSAVALEGTFNSLFENNGEESLARVTANGLSTADGVVPNKSNGLLRGATTLVRGSGCRNCPKDDDTQAMMPEVGISFTMVGGSGCRNCPKDDDVASIIVHQADWEIEFASVLSKAPYAALAGVQKCNIILNNNDNEEVVELEDKDVGGSGCRNCPKDDDVMKAMPVVLDVQCEQIDFAEMSLSALLTAAKTLEDTYNAIHRLIDGDDAPYLERIQVGYGPHFSSGRTTPEDPGAMAIVSGSGCRNCPKDDDVLSENAQQQQHNLVFIAVNRGVGRGSDCPNCLNDDSFVTEEALKAWEALFVASLHKDNKHSGKENFFQHIGQCSIVMSAVIVDATTE